jgi:hypothetical protein
MCGAVFGFVQSKYLTTLSRLGIVSGISQWYFRTLFADSVQVLAALGLHFHTLLTPWCTFGASV